MRIGKIKLISRIGQISLIDFIHPIGLIGLIGFISLISHVKIASAAIIQKAPNNLGLVGAWNFNEGAGNIAGDSSGFSNHGSLSGFNLSGSTSNWVGGKHGKALDFDGSNDHVSVTVPAGSVLDFTTASRPTVAFWLKVASLTSDVRLIEEPRNGGWGVEYTTAGLLRLITYGGSTVSWSGVVTADNVWHHYVVTYDGVNATLYKDGVLVSAQAYSPGWSSSASTLYLGGEGIYHLSGRMDDVRVYSRALTATQVSSLYQSGQVTRKQISQQGLVGYWALNEGRGAIAGDGSGNNKNGTLTNFALSGVTSNWTVGKRGGALDFDGSNDYVSLGGVSDLVLSSSLTLAGWVKFDVGSTYKFIVSKGDTGTRNYDLAINDASSNRPYISFTQGAFNYLSCTATGSYSINTWYHVVGTYDGSNQRIYVDGVEKNSCSVTGSPDNANASPAIGRLSDGSSYFNGYLDDIRIYNRALSAAEVIALYRQNETRVNSSQNDKLTNGLVGLWSFNGADYNPASTTAEVLDRSQEGNNGNAINGALPIIGNVGQGMYFDGVDDYVDVSSNSDFDVALGTVNLWLKTNGVWGTDGSDPNNAALIFGRHNSSFSWSGITIIQDNASNGGDIIIQLKKAGASVVCQMNPSNNLADNSWHSLALVFSQTNGDTGYLYIDGALVTTCVNNDNWAFNSQPIRLANSDDTYWEEWQGTLDEVRFYNRNLSASEIKQLYNLGR